MTIASAALLLFLILDPLGNIPVFLGLLKELPPARQRRVLARELLIALVVLMLFLWGGQYALELMHLRQESVSIAGGIILFLIGLRMIFPPADGIMGELPDGEPFIVPIAIPMIAGPSGMAAVMLLGSQEPGRMGDWMLALTIAWAATAVITAAEAVVSRIDGFAHAARSVREVRLGDVLAGNADLLAVLQIAHAAMVERLGHRLADLALEAPYEPAAVHRTLVLAVEPAINDTHGHGILPRLIAPDTSPKKPPSGRAVRASRRHEDFLTRRYHSHSSLTCFSV